MFSRNRFEVIEKLIGNSDDKSLRHLSSIFSREAASQVDSYSEEELVLLHILKNVSSMILSPQSNNEPFQPLMQMADGGRSALPCDFTTSDLSTLETLIDYVSYVPLKARIADLLWVSIKPKNPKHARIAIDCYLSLGINPKTWLNEEKIQYERAYRLAKLIKDSERLDRIEQEFKVAFNSDEEEFIDIAYSLAVLIDEVGALKNNSFYIAEKLEKLGLKLMSSGSYYDAIRYFDFSSRKYKEGSNETKYVLTLVYAAECYTKYAEIHFNSGEGTKLISSGLFESAIQAYRKIPRKYREEFSVEENISKLRHRLNEAGKHTLSEMGIVRTPIEDAEQIVALSKQHVAGKASEFMALLYFSGICEIPDYDSLKEIAKNSMSQNLFSSLFGSTQYSSDGRVIAKTPAVGFNDSLDEIEVALLDKMIRNFAHNIDFNVRLSIVPALHQILAEHTFSKNFVLELCELSPIVPKSNIKLVFNALWLGFEFDFLTAIHLIAPQIEMIVRDQLKKNGTHTTHIDKDGIEHENGLSTLLDMPESVVVFGQNFLFELKALFADSIGPNLRNEVAHGLLTDNADYSASLVYAWWLLLREVVCSIVTPVKKLLKMKGNDINYLA